MLVKELISSYLRSTNEDEANQILTTLKNMGANESVLNSIDATFHSKPDGAQKYEKYYNAEVISYTTISTKTVVFEVIRKTPYPYDTKLTIIETPIGKIFYDSFKHKISPNMKNLQISKY